MAAELRLGRVNLQVPKIYWAGCLEMLYKKNILWILTALPSNLPGQDKIEKHNVLPWRFDRDIKNRLCQFLCEFNQLGQESQMKLPDSMTDRKMLF